MFFKWSYIFAMTRFSRETLFIWFIWGVGVLPNLFFANNFISLLQFAVIELIALVWRGLKWVIWSDFWWQRYYFNLMTLYRKIESNNKMPKNSVKDVGFKQSLEKLSEIYCTILTEKLSELSSLKSWVNF